MSYKYLLIPLVAVSTFVLQGCLVAPVVPPYGTIYSDFSAPLDYDSEASINAPNMKRGEAKTVSFVGLIATGDASTRAAAENGGLSVIHYADYHYKNIVGIIQEYTTIVYGE
jgi:hypothetical protein